MGESKGEKKRKERKVKTLPIMESTARLSGFVLSWVGGVGKRKKKPKH